MDLVKVDRLTGKVGRLLGDAVDDSTADEIAMAVMMALVSTLARGMKPERMVALLLKSIAAAQERAA